MAACIYFICTLLSAACAILLFKAYSEKKFNILLWSAVGFVGFTLNNLLLLIDVTLLPSIDLSIWRTIPALAGVSMLLYGLITDTV